MKMEPGSGYRRAASSPDIEVDLTGGGNQPVAPYKSGRGFQRKEMNVQECLDHEKGGNEGRSTLPDQGLVCPSTTCISVPGTLLAIAIANLFCCRDIVFLTLDLQISWIPEAPTFLPQHLLNDYPEGSPGCCLGMERVSVIISLLETENRNFAEMRLPQEFSSKPGSRSRSVSLYCSKAS